MKAQTFALAASLALNVTGAWWLLETNAAAPAAARADALDRSARPAAAMSTSAPSGNPAPGASAGPAIDYATHRDRLLAAGFPADVVTDAIRACLEEPRLARQREFYALAATQPWWRGGLAGQNLTPEQQRELRELRKAEREEILRVLGPAAYLNEAERERYAFLPPDKAERLATLERDYNELRHDTSDAAVTANPQERRRLLAAEYERDLAALLTPEERAQLHERESNTARNLASRFEYFAGTEEEYRRLFVVQKEFDEKFSGPVAFQAADAGAARGQALQKLAADIEAALDPERYAAFLQSQRPEYRALVELQRRFALPQATFAQAAKLHAEVSAAGLRIADDASLDREQKKTALAELAATAQTGIRSTLGPALGETFLTATRSTWIDLLERGSVYAAQPTGGMTTRHVAVDRTPPPPPMPAPKS